MEVGNMIEQFFLNVLCGIIANYIFKFLDKKD
nr:MAG TPA: hypothetical protein [Caudoviricetes sp.]